MSSNPKEESLEIAEELNPTPLETKVAITPYNHAALPPPQTKARKGKENAKQTAIIETEPEGFPSRPPTLIEQERFN